jgi:hypothetical protein
MRKRNKKTTIVFKPELSKVTEYILAGMGEEGKSIRGRLMSFLEHKAASYKSVMKKITSDGAITKI